MDRRSWLWRRKSEKNNPPETDSSGSISSLSERFSDDQLQGYQIHNPHSPEVTSKSLPNNLEESAVGNDTVKTLSDKLSAALLNLSAKEELVKQNAKVAEEAVSGWEHAEKEVVTLKQQLEAATKKNSALEDRVGHLDAALKECVRELRQSREEQEQRINEALARKTCEWESTKSELETQLLELHDQIKVIKSEAPVPVDPDFLQKLEAAEKESSSLKVELLSRTQELEMRTLERDLTTQAAETASKLHLESIKKVTKLEAECRRLKSVARKASTTNDHKSFPAPSIYVESFTDSQSDCGERLLAVESDAPKTSGLAVNQSELGCSDSRESSLVTGLDKFKDQMPIGRNLMVPSLEIDLMDDFLEMERLASLPNTGSGSSYLQSGPVSDEVNSADNPWKAELESLICRTAELEEKLEQMQEEKVRSEITLTEYQWEVEMLQTQLKEADAKLFDLQARLAIANESNQAREEEIKEIGAKTEATESQLRIAKAEIKDLLSDVGSLTAEVEKERSLYAKVVSKCQTLEDELSKLKHEAELQQEAELRRITSFNSELKIKQEKELAVAARKFAECQQTISSLGNQLKSLMTWEDFLLDSEKSLDLNVEGIQCNTNVGEKRR